MAISTCNIWSNPLWSNNLGNDLSKSTITAHLVVFLTSTLFPRFQGYYSQLQQMEYIAIAPCITWRAYPGFALDETFPKVQKFPKIPKSQKFNNLGNDLSKSTTTSPFGVFLASTLFPRFQSYYSHLQQMEYIAIAPCIKWRW